VSNIEAVLVQLDDYANPSLSDAECDDGDLCNGKEICVKGRCVPGAPLQCDDGNACTVGDVCQAGACQPGPGTLDCAAKGPCFEPVCSPDAGCVPLPDGTACPDGTCRRGACLPPRSCETLADTVTRGSFNVHELGFVTDRILTGVLSCPDVSVYADIDLVLESCQE
jgi:hypothetical protein